jgi:hypothetical protein
MFVMLSNVLKRCDDLTVNSSAPSTITDISNDSITTTEWEEMSIFEKVTVLRALCDARLNKADIDQVTEVRLNRISLFIFSFVFYRMSQPILFDSNHSVKIHVAINYGISVIPDFIVIHGINLPSKFYRSTLCPE